MRCDVSDRLLMCSQNVADSYVIRGSSASYYDKPIAMLPGPGAVSSGDQVALRISYHPRARVFGKRTTTAFNAPATVDMGNAMWSGRYAPNEAFLVSAPSEYLTHLGFPVDEDVWLTPDDVARGDDTVVKAAMAWIASQTTSVESAGAVAAGFAIGENYPNPFRGSTVIPYRIEAAGAVRITVHDLLGRTLRTLLDLPMQPGSRSVVWDARDDSGHRVPPGVYLCRLQQGARVATRTMLLMQ